MTDVKEKSEVQWLRDQIAIANTSENKYYNLYKEELARSKGYRIKIGKRDKQIRMYKLIISTILVVSFSTGCLYAYIY